MIKFQGHRRSGFTLLEVLVVLVIVSLASLLVMQGLQYGLGLQGRIKRQMANAHLSELQEQWFRLSIRSMIDYGDKFPAPSENPSFTGSGRDLAGVSLYPLVGRKGLPVASRWALMEEGGTTIMRYLMEGRAPVDIARWRRSQAEFQYLDDKGEFHDQWPPEPEDRGLPAGILVVVNGEVELTWYVTISSANLRQDDFSFIE